MSIPEWALKFKEKGTQIHLLKGKYYLYKVSSKWDSTKKRAVKKTDEYLGRITESGLIKPKTKQMEESLKKITIKDYAPVKVLYDENKDILESLQSIFPLNYKELFIAAVFRFLYQTPLKNIDYHYRKSFLTELLPEAKVSDKGFTSLLKEVGLQRGKITEFLKKFISDSETAIFDVTNILSNSENMSINQVGYNSKRVFDPQVNFMFMFSTDKQLPVYYRVLPGNIRDVKAFKLCVEETDIEKAIVITDKGFYSASNITMLENEKLNYIIPIKRNSELIDYSKVLTGNKKDYDGFFMFENRAIWHYTYFVDGRRIIIYIDDKLKVEEERDYLMRIENKNRGYTIEEFHKKNHRFGTIAVITRLDEPAEKVYQYLKSRMEIETMFDALKNVLNADRSYMHGDAELECWMLINFISLIFYYRIYNKLFKAELLKKYSPNDLMLAIAQIKILKLMDKWIITEIPTKLQALINKVNIPIT